MVKRLASPSQSRKDRIISAEVTRLKAQVNARDAKKKMKGLIVRLIYVEMLGHDATFAYINMSAHRIHKYTSQAHGILVLRPHAIPEHGSFMLVNQLQRDLKSARVLEVCAALMASSKLMTNDMVLIIPTIAELLRHTSNVVRKKAAMAFYRCYQLDPGSVNIYRQFRRTLCDKDPAVMGASLYMLTSSQKRTQKTTRISSPRT